MCVFVVPPPPPAPAVPLPPGPPLPGPPSPPADPIPPPAPIVSSSPCPGPVTVALPHVKRDEQEPAVTEALTRANSAYSESLPEDDVRVADASVWSRVAYYTSTAPAAATGFAFLANLGDPQKSGTFD